MKNRLNKIYLLIIALMMLLSYQNVNAMAVKAGTNERIFDGGNGLGYFVMVDSMKKDGTISIEWTNQGEVYTASNVDFIRLKANGKDAFCADFNKTYAYNSCYKIYGYFAVGTFPSKIYQYGIGSEKNYKKAQVIFWALKKSGYLTNLVPGSGSGTSQILLRNPKPSKQEFVSLMSSAFKGAGLTSSSISGNAFKLSNESFCDCIWDGKCAGVGGTLTTNTDGSKQLIINTGGQYTYPSGYFTEETYANMYYDACIAVAGAKDKDAAWEEWSYKLNAASEVAKENTILGEDLGDIYDAINRNAGIKLGQFIPVSCATGVVDGDAQNIYAPYDDIEPTSCANFLAATKLLYPNKSAQEIYNEFKDIIKAKTDSEIYLTTDKKGVYCKNMDKKCYEIKRTWSYIRKLNPGKNPKFGNAWIYVLNGDESHVETKIDCSCDVEASKFTSSNSSGSQYQGSCTEFKAWYKNWKQDLAKNHISVEGEILTCTDSPHFAKCSDGPDEPDYTCTQLLSDARSSNWSLDTFKSKITDPEKAQINSDGLLDCEDRCKPQITTSNLCCSQKDTSLAVIKLTDADDSSFNIDGNRSCINANNAYTVDGNRIASADDSLSVPEYCTVYCWEEFEVDLPYEPALTNIQTPNPTNTINSGRVFWWGLNYSGNVFGYVSAHRVCKSNPNYGLFEERWNENEKAIIQAYAEYLAQKAYYEKIISGNYEVKESSCVLKAAQSGSGCCMLWKDGKPNNGFTGACDKSMSPSDCNNRGTYDYSGGGTPAEMGNEYYIEKTKDVKYTGTVATGSGLSNLRIPSSYEGKADSSEVKTECSKTKPANYDWAGEAKKELDSRRDKVLSLVKNRATLYAAIKQCQDSNIDINKLYSNQFNIEINDESLDTFGVKNKKMIVKAVSAGYTTNRKETQDGSANLYCNLSGNGLLAEMDMSVYDVCASNDLMDHYDYNGNYYTTIATYAPFVWDFNGIYEIKYSEDMHFYVYSDNDKLSTDPTRSTVINENNMQAVLTEAGWYGIKYDARYGIPKKFTVHGKQEMSVSVKMSGFGNRGHFDALINGSQYASKFMEGCYSSASSSNAISPVGDHYDGTYTCPYQVANLIYCPPGDPDCPGDPPPPPDFSIVYRIIDMGAGNTARIFPGKDGNDGTKSRKIGSNWASFISKNPNKFKKITTSTNDTKTGIYNQKPLYSIELTPTLIGQIRKDNNSYRDSGKDPYTSYTNTNNKPKIACKYGDTVYNVEEKSCVSSYITKLIKQGKITGRFADSNESKRIKLIHDYKTAYN